MKIVKIVPFILLAIFVLSACSSKDNKKDAAPTPTTTQQQKPAEPIEATLYMQPSCPHCQATWLEMGAELANDKDIQLELVFIDLDSKEDLKPAQMMIWAKQQGKQIEMAEKWFQTLDSKETAKSIGIDNKTLQQLTKDKKIKTELKEQLDVLDKLEVQKVPTLVLEQGDKIKVIDGEFASELYKRTKQELAEK